MLNLAPIRFARVLTRQNGPVETIEYSRIDVVGRPLYQAKARLSERLFLERKRNVVFSNADGTGTGRWGIVARHKAISEAIERWALYYLLQAGFDDLYGLKEDPTSTGMSAFPGLFDAQARARALSEAVERYCLVGWWDGLLSARTFRSPESGVSARTIENPLGRDTVILVWRKAKGGYYVYGHAASRNDQQAYWQAIIEMERANVALSQYYLNNPGFEADDLDTLSNPMERRILYYSLPEGHQEFLERVNRVISGAKSESPRPIVDEKVDGPWNRYATVWRVLYPMPSRDYLNPQLNTFFW